MTTYYESACVLCGGPAEYTRAAGTNVLLFGCGECSTSYQVYEPTAKRLQAAPPALRRALAKKVAEILPGKVGVIMWPAADQFPVVQVIDRADLRDDEP